MKNLGSLFLILVLSIGLLSCEDNDNKNKEGDVYDLSWKSGLASNSMALNVDGAEYVLDSCTFEYFCGGFTFASYTENEEVISEIVWYPIGEIKTDTTKLSSIKFINQKDTLEVKNIQKGMISIKHYESSPIDNLNDSVYIEGVIHIKFPEGNIPQNIKGQFHFKGIRPPNKWLCL